MVEIHIPVRVACELSERGDGAWWKIVDVIDEREGWALGDTGIYEYDAELGFPQGLQEAILNILGETGEFEDENAVFIVEITLSDRRTELAYLIARFSGRDTLSWPFRHGAA